MKSLATLRWVLVATTCVLVADAVRRVVLRMGFDYDLLLWADDYFMTSMFKLAAGVPVYTSISEANSTVYAPGGPYLHHVILSPLGLGTSLLANRILTQLWLVLAVIIGARVVLRIAEDMGVLDAFTLAERRVFVALAALVLALGAYANPVADALHPTNLELCVIGATQLVLIALPRWSLGRRVGAACFLTAAAVLVKQSTGATVAAALAWGSLRDPVERLSTRLGSALAAPLTLAVATLTLVVWTNGGFRTWAIDVLAAHPFEWWKVSDLYAGFFLLFLPALIVTLGGGVRLLPRGAAWGRAGTALLCAAPFALAALFKAMGGPNNLAVIGWLLLVLALPHLLASLHEGARVVLRARPSTLGPLLTALLVVQIVLLYPRRRTPEPSDHEKARLMCDYAAARARCGERVFLGRGAVCLHRGGVAVPEDRMMSIIEATLAGRQSEVAFYDRVRARDYDVMIFWVGDLQWGGRRLWDLLRVRYAPFFTTGGEVRGDFWFHGWQGFATWPVAYWERLDEKGRHEVSPRGAKCDFDGRR